MKPGVPAGIRIVLISGRPSGRSPVRAVTVTTLVIAVPEFVMNDLAPSTTQLSPSSTALVRVAPASDPASGSVRPKAASARPATRSGSQRSFWSGVPKVRIGLIPRPTPADRVMPIDWSTRPSSSMATQRLVKSASAPPNSSGTTRPNSPRSPIFGTSSTGKRCCSSHSCDVRRDLGERELAHHPAEVLVLLRQLEHPGSHLDGPAPVLYVYVKVSIASWRSQVHTVEFPPHRPAIMHAGAIMHGGERPASTAWEGHDRSTAHDRREEGW